MAKKIDTVKGIEEYLIFNTIDVHEDDAEFIRNNTLETVNKFLNELDVLVDGPPESILIHELIVAINSEKLPNGRYPIGVKLPLKNFDPKLLVAVWTILFEEVLDRSLDMITRSPKSHEFYSNAKKYFANLWNKDGFPFSDPKDGKRDFDTSEHLTNRIENVILDLAELQRFSKTNVQDTAEKFENIELENKRLENSIDKKFNSALKHIEQQTEKMNKYLTEMKDDVSRSLEVQNNTIFETTKNQVAAALDGFTLKPTEELWISRKSNSYKAFVVSAIAVVLLLVGGPWFAWANHDTILNFLKEVQDTNLAAEKVTGTAIFASQITRLMFLGLPIFGFFYLVRLVVRFMMRSLVLADDAAARQTMLDTYLHLVEKDKDVVKDRPLILEALFRRTPGHGAETIEPPNLTDVLKIKNSGS